MSRARSEPWNVKVASVEEDKSESILACTDQLESQKGWNRGKKKILFFAGLGRLCTPGETIQMGVRHRPTPVNLDFYFTRLRDRYLELPLA